jgi:hypothetical protein
MATRDRWGRGEGAGAGRDPDRTTSVAHAGPIGRRRTSSTTPSGVGMVEKVRRQVRRVSSQEDLAEAPEVGRHKHGGRFWLWLAVLGRWLGWVGRKIGRISGKGRSSATSSVAGSRAVAAVCSVRNELLVAIGAAERGEPLVDTADGAMSAVSAGVAARLRATRAPATHSSARSALRQLARFVEVNESLAAGAERLTPKVWDAVVEAFIVAKVDPPQPHGWLRPSGWGRITPSAAGTAAGAAAAALDRLGYGPTVWPRLRVMRRALGCNDADDVVRIEPVFAWEVWRGVRHPQSTIWELCGRALVVLGMVCGGRTGSVTRLLVEQLQETDDPRVFVLRPRSHQGGAPAYREKQQHARATLRGRRGAAVPMTLEHWALEVGVRPWLAVLRRWRAVGSQYLFPSLVRHFGARTRPASGRPVEDGLWLDPVRPWSARAVTAALHHVLGVSGRSWQGLRAGNNLELRRLGAASDVTRRTLHGRTVRPQLGSEAAYTEVFGEECRQATRRLGELRIERVGGQLATTATSSTAGEADDWQQLNVARPLPTVSPPSSSAEEESSGPDSRVVEGRECGRCFRKLGPRDHGWRCDDAACSWAVCLACHPGGMRAPLWCPRHTHYS